MRPRRVVTAQHADGRSVVVEDCQVEPVTTALLGDQELSLIWGTDVAFEVPCDGGAETVAGFYPPPGGFRFWYFTLPPDAASTPPPDLDLDAATDEVNRKLPGLLGVLESDNPRMHTTDTVDVDLVVSGEVWLELDDGVEVHLRAGDCVVLNGNRHAWRNRSTETSIVAVAIVGALRS